MKRSETIHPTPSHYFLKDIKSFKKKKRGRKWDKIKHDTYLAKYIRTNTTAVQVATLATPTAECLTAIITTCKFPTSIESFTVLTYQYIQKLMEGHSEGSSRCAPNVTVADCTVQSQMHHHPCICTKEM